VFSSRHLEEDQKLAKAFGKGALAGTLQEAAAFGDVLLFAVPCSLLPGPSTPTLACQAECAWRGWGRASVPTTEGVRNLVCEPVH